MSIKYYRVKQTNFMWVKGAIIQSSGSGYTALSDLYNTVDVKTEYISDHIVENPQNSEFFERVYKVDLATKTLFELKDKAIELLEKGFKE